MISEDTAVTAAAILTLALEIRLASGKETDPKSGAALIEKNWEHFDAVLAVAYDLGETRKKKRRRRTANRRASGIHR